MRLGSSTAGIAGGSDAGVGDTSGSVKDEEKPVQQRIHGAGGTRLTVTAGLPSTFPSNVVEVKTAVDGSSNTPWNPPTLPVYSSPERTAPQDELPDLNITPEDLHGWLSGCEVKVNKFNPVFEVNRTWGDEDLRKFTKPTYKYRFTAGALRTMHGRLAEIPYARVHRGRTTGNELSAQTQPRGEDI